MDPEREVHDSSTAASEMTTCTDGAAGQSAVQGGVQTGQTTDMLSQALQQERSETRTPMQEGNRFFNGRGKAPHQSPDTDKDGFTMA